jgi:hypothetical protein
VRVKVKVRRVKVKARRVRARRSNRTAALGRRPNRLVTVMAVAVMVATAVATAVATVRVRRNRLRRNPVATAPRRANPKAHGRLALRCLAASRATKAVAVQVDAIRPAPDNAGVK